jgi:membrane-bound lytic murein transglycosylase D
MFTQILISRVTLAAVAVLALSACQTLPQQPGVESAQAMPWDTSGPSVIPTSPLQQLDAAQTPTNEVAVAGIEAPADLWERMRRGFDMPDLDNALVRRKEQWYSSRPEYIDRMVTRGSRYLFHIVEEIERREMPLELALLPIVESAFNPQAVSHAKAAGMWQFMPATGRDFDLKQNAFRDDRRDVLASTQAALDYLERLHTKFGDWHLALAAYNWGSGNVQRAIRNNRNAGRPTGYTDLRMPRETREYVPKLQAVKNIVFAPERFAVALPDVGNHPYFDSVNIDRDMDVALIARLADIEEAHFRQLNPSHNKPVIMAAGTSTILLPWDNALLFMDRLKKHDGPTATWTVWRVPKTTSVANAAKQHGLSEARLREVNRIPPRMAIRAGATILVPRQGRLDRDVPESMADRGQILLVSDAAGAQRVRVKSGDTLSGIARRYGVSVANIMRWNGLSNRSVIRVGEVLVVHTRVQASSSSKTSVR